MVQKQAHETPWYTENWYEEDIIMGLRDIGVETNEENIGIAKIVLSHIFDDKSDRNEAIRRDLEKEFFFKEKKGELA